MGLFSGPGVNPSLKGLASNVLALAPGQTQVITPAGWYMARLGPYTVLQTFDPVANLWRSVGDGSTGATSEYFYSDGNNYRFANLTGAPVGALLTTAGSGYVTAPTITVSAGGSQWRAILGGAISTTISIVNAGVGYTYAPTIVIAAPPPNGIQATATCTIAAGIVNAITVTNQGAGYTTPPIITFLNDYRETLNATNNITLGYNAAAIATLTGSGTVTGVCASAQSLYTHERFSISSGGYRYWFDCPPGVYETTLLESETYWSTTNQRVFNAFIEGEQVLTNFDIFAAESARTRSPLRR